MNTQAAPAMRRVVLLVDRELGGSRFTLGQVLDVPPGVARTLVAQFEADDTPAAITQALQNAAAEEAQLESEIKRADGAIKVGQPYFGFTRRDQLRERLDDVKHRKSVAHVAMRDWHAQAAPAEEEIKLTPIEEREAFAEAKGVLAALERDLVQLEADMAALEGERGKGTSHVDVVSLALGKVPPAMSEEDLRDELGSLAGRKETIRKAIQTQRVRIEQVRERQIPAVLQELRGRRAEIAGKVLEGLRLLSEAHASENALERAAARAGYGREAFPRLALQPRLPVDAHGIFERCALDAKEFIADTEVAPVTARTKSL